MDPGVIRKLIITSTLLWIPAALLIFGVWKKTPREADGGVHLRGAWWIAATVTVGYLLWLLNGIFQVFDFYMLVWPLFGGLASLVGCLLAFFKRENRWELAIANILLMVLGLASIVAPN